MNATWQDAMAHLCEDCARGMQAEQMRFMDVLWVHRHDPHETEYGAETYYTICSAGDLREEVPRWKKQEAEFYWPFDSEPIKR